MHIHRRLAGTVLVALVSLSGIAPASSQIFEVAFPPKAPVAAAIPPPELRGLRLVVDFAAVLNVEGGMSVVAVGSPDIADASLVNHRTVIVTGHTPGTTNLIALDEAGNILADVQVYVSAQKPGMVRVHKGTLVEIQNCMEGLCEGTAPVAAAEN